MAATVKREQWIEIPQYQLRFEFVGRPGSGFFFDCDKNGKLQPLAPAGQESYHRCVSNTHPTPVVSLGIQCWTHRYREPAVLLCDCGQKLSLSDGMTNECTCGRFYDGSGQSLSHPRHWGEETGERFDDHGHLIL
jgi:hypothetical protein